MHLGETNSSVTTCKVVFGSFHLNPKPVESNSKFMGDVGGQTLPVCTWARGVCEETMFQALKLFGVGVTLEVRFQSLKKPVESNRCIACHVWYADRT